jgi:peptide/nickel transport system ATP-binding protein
VSRSRRVISSTTAEHGPLLEVADLKTHFKTAAGRVRAVDGVSLTLDRGKTLGVVGESGSGKSVLSRSIMGLLPARNVVREGSILFEGHDLTALNDAEMRRYWGTELAMVFQDPMTSLNPVMKVGNQITESLRFHLDMPKDEANATALALLKSVGIPEAARRLRQYPHELSGGMRQRVVIAMSLAMVLVTHDLGVVAGRAHDVAVMYAGKIVERAPTRTLFASVRMPYTEALLQSIPKLDYPSHTRLTAIPGRPPNLLHPPKGCSFAPRCRYAQERCLEEEPGLTEAETPGHAYACFYPVGTEAGAEAKARNESRGVTAAGTAVTIGSAVVA